MMVLCMSTVDAYSGEATSLIARLVQTTSNQSNSIWRNASPCTPKVHIHQFKSLQIQLHPYNYPATVCSCCNDSGYHRGATTSQVEGAPEMPSSWMRPHWWLQLPQFPPLYLHITGNLVDEIGLMWVCCLTLFQMYSYGRSRRLFDQVCLSLFRLHSRPYTITRRYVAFCLRRQRLGEVSKACCKRHFGHNHLPCFQRSARSPKLVACRFSPNKGIPEDW